MQRERPRATGAVLAGLLTAAYVSLWFNKYLGLTTDGWYYFFAQQWRSGLMPYRDFHLFTPPVHLFENAVLQSLFGEQLIWIHIFGLVSRAVLAAVLYLWTSRIARPLPSLFGTLAAIVVYSGDVNEVVLYVSQDATLWAVLAGYVAAVALAAGKNGHRLALLAGSGLFAGVSAFSKQTTGLAVSAAIFAVLLVREVTWARRASAAAAFCAGWAVPAALTLRWLDANHALGPFLDQVFLQGGASKGGLWATLTRPVAELAGPKEFGVLAISALLILAGWWALGRDEVRSAWPRLTLRAKLVGAAVPLLLILVFSAEYIGSFRRGQLICCYLALIGSIVIALRALPRWWRERTSVEAGDRLLFGVVSGALALSCAMSFPAWEGMAVPGLALVLALGLEVETGDANEQRWLRPCAAGSLVLLQLVHSAGMRLVQPYSWAQWSEPPVQAATIAPDTLPTLAGFQLSLPTVSYLERLVDAIRRHSRPSDPVFVFPHVPLLYSLSGRRPPTFGYVHFIDVAPDALVRSDLEILRARPPRVIVTFTHLPGGDAYNEWLFRGGRRSAQKDLADYLMQLGESPAYEKVLELPLFQAFKQTHLVVFARRQGSPPSSGSQGSPAAGPGPGSSPSSPG